MPEEELKKILKITEEGDFALFDEIQGTRDDISALAKSIQKTLEQKQNINIDTKTITEAIKSGFSSLKSPEIKIPEFNTKKIENAIKDTIKDIKISIPETKINIPKTEFPNKMVVEGDIGIRSLSPDNPLPVQLHDSKGNPFSLEKLTQGISSGGGTSGGRKPLTNDGNKQVVESWDFAIQTSRRKITDTIPVLVLGFNSAVGTSREDLWTVGGEYVFPTTAQTMRVISTSASDAAAGTGARTVDVHGLDADYNEIEETVTLDGLTPVNTVKQYLRTNDFHVMSTGSTGAAVGDISLQNTAGTVNYSRIDATTNRQRQAIYTVPAGKTLYIASWLGGVGLSAGGKYAQFFLRSTSTDAFELTPGVFQFRDIQISQDSTTVPGLYFPIRVPGKADVKLAAISENAICAAHFDGWLE